MEMHTTPRSGRATSSGSRSWYSRPNAARATPRRLDRLRPQPVSRAGKPHMTVVDLFPHRHRKPEADATDEILLVVAIEDDGVNDANRRLARVEVEAENPRQPVPIARIGAMNSLEFLS